MREKESGREAQASQESAITTPTKPAHPQKPEQKFSGAADVNTGNMPIAPQHPIHSGGDVLPIFFGLGVEFQLIFHPVAGHGCGFRLPPEKPGGFRTLGGLFPFVRGEESRRGGLKRKKTPTQ